MRKKILAGILAVVMSVTMIPGSLMEKAGVKKDAEASVALQNPKIVTDSSMTAGQKVTYDCVWFGSYPQTEIVDQASTCGTYGKAWGQSSDYEENTTLYTTLQNTTGWDSNDNLILDGTKYRRIKASDAHYADYGDTVASDHYYRWNSEDFYHFFRYDPIKWRVLNVSGTQIFLLADKSLDNQKYYPVSVANGVTWKTSTIRSWLNGNGASVNAYGTDYSKNSFISSAFSNSEIEAIASTDLDNKTTGPYSESNAWENTTDKIFFLAPYDLYHSNSSELYGFSNSGDTNDEARRCLSSTFAKAMGEYSRDFQGNNYWWLRAPGSGAFSAEYVDCNGCASCGGYGNFGSNHNGVRPALYLNLSSSDLFSYAGTVCTDGTVHEEGGGEVTPITYTITYNANGGIGAPQNQIKTRGEELILSTAEPTRSGYTFLGWGTSSSSTNVIYNKGGSYTSDSNITLYAIWKKSITLSYNANGGSEAPSSQSGDMYNADTSTNLIISTAKPTRNNYSFLGWSTSSSATSASYTGGNSISINEDTTLYAVWQENPSSGYTISYNANGGEGAPPPQRKETGLSITLSSTKPTRYGYEFAGWSTDNTSTSINYSLGDTYSEDKDLILYAIWKKTIHLNYYAEEASNVPASDSVTIYNAASEYTFRISGMMPTRSGYYFLGWSTKNEATSVSYNSGESITISSDTTLYAIWKKKSEEGSDSDDPIDPTPQPVTKKLQTITASGKTVPINNAGFSLGAKTSGNGKLTYKSSNTKVAAISSAGKVTVKGYGFTTITITASETSTYKKATKAVTITVVPKKMKLKSVKSPKKGQLQVVWIKDKSANGYQIQFSRDMDFKKGVYQKSVSPKLKKLKKPVTGLISKKRYYVRIRSYKKVSGKKLYGIWSYGKVVKIK